MVGGALIKRALVFGGSAKDFTRWSARSAYSSYGNVTGNWQLNLNRTYDTE